jgi:DNA invertase Pin-like site-specific DNA recombinase
MRIGYARVSTKDQKADLQHDALHNARCDRIFKETESGAKTDRPQLKAALDMLREGDTFVIWRFDRIGRSTTHLLSIFNDLKLRGITLLSLTEGIDTNTSTGQLIFGITALFAEFERDLIKERAAAGRAAARARGITGGRAKLLDSNQVIALKKMAIDVSIPVRTTLQTFGISKSTYYQYLKS